MSVAILKKLAGQTAIYGLSSIIGRFINFLLVPIHTRLFSPVEYGVVTDIYSLTSFIAVFLLYGMETAFFRYAKQHESPTTVYATAFWSVAGTTSFFWLAGMCFLPDIAKAMHYSAHPEYVQMMWSILAVDALCALPFAYLRFAEKPIRFASFRLVNIGINVALTIFFFLVCPRLAALPEVAPYLSAWYDPSFGVGYVFLSNLLASLITLLLLGAEILRAHLKQFNFDLLKKMLAYALPLVIVGLAGMINEVADRQMIKYLLPREQSDYQLGIYGACYRLSMLMAMFTQAYRLAAEPFFFAQSDNKDATAIYAGTMKYFVLIGCLLVVGITFYLDIIKYFIGSRYHEGVFIVPILLLANLFLGIYYNLSIWYKLTNTTIIGAYISVVGAVITIVMNLILLPRMGYVGAAWTTLACYVVICLISAKLGQNRYPIPYPWRTIGLYIGVAISLILFDRWAIAPYLPSFSAYLLRTFLLILLSAAVYQYERKRGFSFLA